MEVGGHPPSGRASGQRAAGERGKLGATGDGQRMRGARAQAREGSSGGTARGHTPQAAAGESCPPRRPGASKLRAPAAPLHASSRPGPPPGRRPAGAGLSPARAGGEGETGKSPASWREGRRWLGGGRRPRVASWLVEASVGLWRRRASRAHHVRGAAVGGQRPPPAPGRPGHPTPHPGAGRAHHVGGGGRGRSAPRGPPSSSGRPSHVSGVPRWPEPDGAVTGHAWVPGRGTGTGGQRSVPCASSSDVLGPTQRYMYIYVCICGRVVADVCIYPCRPLRVYTYPYVPWYVHIYAGTVSTFRRHRCGVFVRSQDRRVDEGQHGHAAGTRRVIGQLAQRGRATACGPRRRRRRRRRRRPTAEETATGMWANMTKTRFCGTRGLSHAAHPLWDW